MHLLSTKTHHLPPLVPRSSIISWLPAAEIIIRNPPLPGLILYVNPALYSAVDSRDRLSCELQERSSARYPEVPVTTLVQQASQEIL
jgi:hypothetical protein